MKTTTQTALKHLLRGVAWLLFAVAGLAFLVGGKAISELTTTDRIVAEMLGFLIAFVSGMLGLVAKYAANDLDESEAPSDK